MEQNTLPALMSQIPMYRSNFYLYDDYLTNTVLLDYQIAGGQARVGHVIDVVGQGRPVHPVAEEPGQVLHPPGGPCHQDLPAHQVAGYPCIQ
jgi:hypothetical protein